VSVPIKGFEPHRAQLMMNNGPAALHRLVRVDAL